MAIFSTRSSKRDADETPSKNVPIDSIETLRTRARQRLIGAVVLVALGIIAFTVLFDSQPRPIPVDIQITMPDKDKPDSTVTTAATTPVAAPAAVETPTTSTSASSVASPAAPSAAATAAAATATVQASASLSAKEEIVAAKTEKKPEVKSEVKPESKPEAKPVVKAEPKPAVKVEAKPEAKPATKPAASDEAAKALAILEGKEPPKAAAAATAAASDATVGRFVVQVGAFAENEKARDARLKVERAGLKTYVHVAETPQGKRIRVRAGPFTTRAEAEKAAAKIKTLDLPAAILTL